MGTNLFEQYYNNPTKSYIYTDILCSNGPSADEISFDINDSAAEKQAIDVVKKNASSFKVDSKSATSSTVTLIIEVKTKSGSDMVNELVGLGSVCFDVWP